MSDNELANDIAKKITEHEDSSFAVSAIVVGDSIGYPRRVVEDDGESHDGEHKTFDEAYDYACSLFGSSEVSVEEEDDYVWFTDNS